MENRERETGNGKRANGLGVPFAGFEFPVLHSRFSIFSPAWFRRRRGLAAAFAAVFAAVLLGAAAPARGAATACRAGISRDTTERLFAILNHPPAETQCTFNGVETDRSSLEARWSRSGTPLPPLRVVPRECAADGAQHTGPFVVEVPPELEQSCPSIGPVVTEFVRQVAAETPV